MPDPVWQTVILMASNLAFVAPAVLAFMNEYYHEGMVYALAAVVSGLYHYVDSTGKCIVEDHHRLCFNPTFDFLDMLLVFMIIVSTVFLVFHPTGSYVPPKRRKVNRLIRSVYNLFLTVVVVALKLEGIDRNYIIIGISALCLLHLLLAAIFFRAYLALDDFDWIDFCVGLAFTGVAFVCFTVQLHYYWLLHSLWHSVMAVGLCFFIEGRQPFWNIVHCMTCGRFCVPKPRPQPIASP